MKTQPTLCPTPQRLAQLVSGSLIEAEAERLLTHIDSCSSCQLQMDELARQDPVIAAARDCQADPVDNAGLSRLIRNAAGLPDEEETRKTRQAQTKSISPAAFVDGLRRSGLMDNAELSQVLSDLSWNETNRSNDSGRLARALIEHQKLTPFQARLLLRGRWKGLVLGNYAILDKLGQGGMGSVFKARHTRMGRVVCLKVVNSAGRQSPDVIDRFRNEARALAALSHPNIVVAHDADESKGIPYLVMEFIDGEDLAKRVRKMGPLSVSQTLEIGIQTARALWYAHRQGVIHRDIKPHNLVATTDDATGRTFVKVLDLGLARFDALITDNPDASVLAAMTNTGVVIGTVDYMAPEQALDSRNADARSDIYSLGCTIFYLLAGRSPFSGETVMQRLVAHREQPAPKLSMVVDGVSAALDAVIEKMLAKEPNDRYQTMDHALSDLQAVAEGRPPSVQVAVTPAVAQPAPVLPNVAAETASALTIDTSDQSAPVRLRAIRRWNKPMYVAVGLAAMVALVFAAMEYWSMPEADETVQIPPPPRVGAEQAVRNGGDGRALVLVSSKKFNEDEFTSLAETLEQRGVNMVVASSKFGSGDPEFGEQIKASFLNVNLANAEPTEFDSVFVLGGETYELTHKNPRFHKEVKRIVEGALRNKVPVTGCTEGYHAVLKDTGLLNRPEFKNLPYKNEVCDAQELAVEAGRLFDELQASKSKP